MQREGTCADTGRRVQAVIQYNEAEEAAWSLVFELHWQELRCP